METTMRSIDVLRILSLLGTCAAAAATIAVQDPRLTPGVIDARATVKMLCTPGYSSKIRNVTSAMKREVCREYGKKPPCPKGFEIDHLVPLSLGGSNAPANLWPQPWKEAREKDRVEWSLYHKVCHGQISLERAQEVILRSWPQYLQTLTNERN
jgi:hypothetical protein